MLPVAILAGGLATRLRPLTETIPKSLVEINGEPFLWHQLRLLRDNGIDRVVLCVSHLGEQVRDSVGDGRHFGAADRLLVRRPRLRSARRARSSGLCLCWARVSSCSTAIPICRSICGRWKRPFEPAAKLALMTVYRNESQWDTSNVEFAGGRILAYNEKLHNGRDAATSITAWGSFRRPRCLVFRTGKSADLATLYRGLAG